MEEFKIITIPTKDENDEKEEESIEKETYDDDGYVPPRKRFFIIPLLIIFVIVAFAVIQIITTYSDFEVENTWERNDATESKYLEYNNNLIKYSSDGIFYTTFSGNLIWNYTYDMNSATVDVCDNYLLVFDKKGNEIDVFSTEGFVDTITTNNPIIDAQVADKGLVAALLQEGTTSYVELYSSDGTVLASGEMHPENSGFPLSITLSSDGTRMMISLLSINEGKVETQINFYDFTDAGKKQTDNIVATYTYTDMLIPQVEFVKNNKAVAFGDSKIIIYNNNTEATVEKEIDLTSELKSIFYNNSYIGYVTETVNEDKEIKNLIEVYNLYGFKCLSKTIDDSFTNISMMNNNEILLNDGEEINIYNLQGFKKFSYDFGENIYQVVPGTTSHRYYVVKALETDEIHLK